MVVQWLRLCAFTAGGVGLIPGQGNKISYATQPKKKKEKLWSVEIYKSLALFIYFFLIF